MTENRTPEEVAKNLQSLNEACRTTSPGSSAGGRVTDSKGQAVDTINSPPSGQVVTYDDKKGNKVAVGQESGESNRRDSQRKNRPSGTTKTSNIRYTYRRTNGDLVVVGVGSEEGEVIEAGTGQIMGLRSLEVGEYQISLQGGGGTDNITIIQSVGTDPGERWTYTSSPFDLLQFVDRGHWTARSNIVRNEEILSDYPNAHIRETTTWTDQGIYQALYGGIPGVSRGDRYANSVPDVSVEVIEEVVFNETLYVLRDPLVTSASSATSYSRRFEVATSPGSPVNTTESGNSEGVYRLPFAMNAEKTKVIFVDQTLSINYSYVNGEGGQSYILETSLHVASGGDITPFTPSDDNLALMNLSLDFFLSGYTPGYSSRNRSINFVGDLIYLTVIPEFGLNDFDQSVVVKVLDLAGEQIDEFEEPLFPHPDPGLEATTRFFSYYPGD